MLIMGKYNRKISDFSCTGSLGVYVIRVLIPFHLPTITYKFELKCVEFVSKSFEWVSDR